MNNIRTGLVQSLVDILRGVPPDEINSLVVEARAHLFELGGGLEVSDVTAKQIKLLVDGGYFEAAGLEREVFLDFLNKLRDHFLSLIGGRRKRLKEIRRGDDEIINTGTVRDDSLAVFVIPRVWTSIPRQLSLLRRFGSRVPSDSFQIIPSGCSGRSLPYIIGDVRLEDYSPDLESSISQYSEYDLRSGLSSEEAIALILHYPWMFYKVSGFRLLGEFSGILSPSIVFDVGGFVLREGGLTKDNQAGWKTITAGERINLPNGSLWRERCLQP